jgi:hypothetical protein
MSAFEILQIGEDVEPTAGIPEGCDLCGHCRMLRHTQPAGHPLPCGGAMPHGAAGKTADRPSGRSKPTEE